MGLSYVSKYNEIKVIKMRFRNKIDVNKLQASRMAAAAAAGQGEKSTTAPIKVDKSVGRNDPCPCGSGKKYKHCHGKLG